MSTDTPYRLLLGLKGTMSEAEGDPVAVNVHDFPARVPRSRSST